MFFSHIHSSWRTYRTALKICQVGQNPEQFNDLLVTTTSTIKISQSNKNRPDKVYWKSIYIMSRDYLPLVTVNEL